MKIRIEFDIDTKDIDSKSDLDAEVSYKLMSIGMQIESEGFDGLPEYTYEDKN